MSDQLLARMPASANRLSNPEKREYTYKAKNGSTIVGGYAEIPKGNFAHFMGFKPPSKEELSGKADVQGNRVIELALQRQMQELGEGMTKNASSFRNNFISDGHLVNRPGREMAMFSETNNAIGKGIDFESTPITPGMLGASANPQYMVEFVEKSRKDSYRYLEAQYRSDWASKSTGMISTMMKARHDAIRKSIGEVR